MRPTRRFRSGAASATSCSTTSPARNATALLNRGDSVQHNFGLSGQVTWRDWLAAAQRADRRRAATTAAARPSSNQPSSGISIPIAASPAWTRSLTASTGGDVDGEPYDNRVDLDGRVNTGSVFASDVLAIGERGTSTCPPGTTGPSISNADRLNPGGGSGSLDGDHVFSRLNPAAGVTFSPRRD